MGRVWLGRIERRFEHLARTRGLPFGAACVAFHDESFPGFPTFPVVHRWHLQHFDHRILPKQFINQSGDPYLFALYSRFGADEETGRPKGIKLPPGVPLSAPLEPPALRT